MAEAEDVRLATVADAAALARLFTDFNSEFDEPTPELDVAAARISEHIERRHSTFLLVGEGPDGFAQLRFQASVYSAGWRHTFRSSTSCRLCAARDRAGPCWRPR